MQGPPTLQYLLPTLGLLSVSTQTASVNDPVVTSPQPQLVRKLLGLCLAHRLPDFGVEITGPHTMAIVSSIMPLATATPPQLPSLSTGHCWRVARTWHARHRPQAWATALAESHFQYPESDEGTLQ